MKLGWPFNNSAITLCLKPLDLRLLPIRTFCRRVCVSHSLLITHFPLSIKRITYSSSLMIPQLTSVILFVAWVKIVKLRSIRQKWLGLMGVGFDAAILICNSFVDSAEKKKILWCATVCFWRRHDKIWNVVESEAFSQRCGLRRQNQQRT